MPSFQKLISGAATKIAKRQAELDALRDPALVKAEREAAERAALEAAARGHFGATWPEGQGLRLKHGSPFKFDRFDFESNLRKGEGALAFGPGGYMTGNDALARQYARDLFEKHGTGPVGEVHLPLKKAAGTQPQAIAEFLRARNVAKGLAEKLDVSTRGTGVTTMSLLPPHLAKKGLAPQGTAMDYYRRQPGPEYAFYTEGRADDFAPYREAMAEAGIKGHVLGQLQESGRVGRGGLAPSDAARIGDKLRNVIEKNYGGSGLRPRVSQSLRHMPQEEYDDLRAYQLARRSGKLPVVGSGGLSTYYAELPSDVYTGPGALRSIDSALRQNLNSTWRAVNDKPGNKRVKLSMTQSRYGGGYIDFSKAALYRALAEGRISEQEFARRLYQADFAATPDELMPYDYPINVAGPKVLGALASLRQRFNAPPPDPNMRGQDILEELQRRAGFAGMSSAEQMRMFREAGIPAMYYLRGGRRSGAGGVPERFTPEDYNFVIFDQDRLGAPDVEEFAQGGRV